MAKKGGKKSGGKALKMEHGMMKDEDARRKMIEEATLKAKVRTHSDAPESKCHGRREHTYAVDNLWGNIGLTSCESKISFIQERQAIEEKLSRLNLLKIQNQWREIMKEGLCPLLRTALRASEVVASSLRSLLAY